MKERQLLLSLCRIIKGVDIKRNLSRRTLKGADELIDETIPQAPKIADRDIVLEPRQVGLTDEMLLCWQTPVDQLKEGIRPQRILIILVSVIRNDPKNPLLRHTWQRVSNINGIPRIKHRGRKRGGQSDLFIELSDGEQSCIARQGRIRNFDFQGARRRKIECNFLNSL